MAFGKALAVVHDEVEQARPRQGATGDDNDSGGRGDTQQSIFSNIV